MNTRKDFNKLKFDHQIEKAHRKGKLIEIIFNDAIENGREARFQTTSILVDPAMVNFLSSQTDYHTGYGEHAVQMSFLLGSVKSEMKYKVFKFTNPSDIHLKAKEPFVPVVKGWVTGYREILENSVPNKIYDYIVNCDPTTTKKYVQWIITTYVRMLKDREVGVDFDDASNLGGGNFYLFFENLPKVKSSIEMFEKIKLSNTLTEEERDIYKYKTIDDFINRMFTAELDDDNGNDALGLNIFNAKELGVIQLGDAEVLYKDKDWVIIHTKTKVANNALGGKTTWCTAGTRYGDMFSHYNKQGYLFVLIKNSTNRTPEKSRFQFHFESNQFMDVLDKRIDISDFFIEYPLIRDHFRSYISERIIKPQVGNIDKITNTLRKFGMVDELIPILKTAKVKKIDFSGLISDSDINSLDRIFEIKTLEELIIRDCNLTQIPKSISKIKNLKILRMSGNAIKMVPNWINGLKKLEVLNLMKNEIDTQFDVSGLKNLLELDLAFNKKLKEMPTGIQKLPKLTSINISLCDIREIPPEIGDCNSLVQFNVIINRNLLDVPDEVVQLPVMLFVGIDETGLTKEKRAHLEKVKRDDNLLIV